MADPIIRPYNVMVLLKLEATEAVEAVPNAAVDAIPVEADSVSYNSPYAIEQSNEATGSLVAGAPLIIGQAATISFRSRIKGANAVYTPTVKPPLHQALQACGKRGQFTAGIAAQAATDGTTTGATFGTSAPATDRALLGMPVAVAAGPNAGAFPLIVSYTAARQALFGETLATAITTASMLTLIANWTYAGTSPRDVSARATDHPSATIYIYEDGTLLRFIGCRGVMTAEGQSARPGFATLNFSGVFAGKSDAPLPNNAVIANHSAPVLVQGDSISAAATLGRKPVPISTWSWENGGELEIPDDPNTRNGFGSGIIADRTPTLSLDPLATTVAARDVTGMIAAGTPLPAVLRHGQIAGNSWALTLPFAQPTQSTPGTRGKLRSEQLSLQARSIGFDAYARDVEAILAFF